VDDPPEAERLHHQTRHDERPGAEPVRERPAIGAITSGVAVQGRKRSEPPPVANSESEDAIVERFVSA
jgi:hypothetical protein